jgi:hypothetical protein
MLQHHANWFAEHLNTEQILWALALAGHFILLIVLLGRERANRYPWFTAFISLSAVRLLADHLLHGKLTTIAFYWQTYVGTALDSILCILVLVELCRRVFSSGRNGRILKARGWFGAGLIVVAIAVAGVWAWGPWPAWQQLTADPAQEPLLLTVLFAIKLMLFTSILTVETGVALRIFGKRFGFPWRSHAQQIALGLATNALGVLSVQGIEDIVRHNVHFTTMQERNQLAVRIGHLFSQLERARVCLWILVFIWWIVWLWRDEPGSQKPVAETGEPLLVEPALAQPELAESALNEHEPLDTDPDSESTAG